MNLEPRYIVVRIDDAAMYLSPRQRDYMNNALRAINDGLQMDGKPPRAVLCLETDWPEYPAALEALTKRLEAERPAAPLEEIKPVEDETKPANDDLVLETANDDLVLEPPGEVQASNVVDIRPDVDHGEPS